MSPARDSRTSPEPGTSPAQASEPADAALRVILVDDENLIRSALATMLSLEADLDVRGEAATVADGLCLAEAVQPDVAVLDLQLPDGDGLELAARIGEASPATRCLVLTSHARPGYLKRALAQGVLGFLPKTSSADQLARAVRSVAAGRRQGWI
ncbi:response regulator containing a CheY-like receiver domain and an HTH DNA-binding domain [Brachybacterium faecium DSM 4810]|uniref:Response regulator containing a CheY-like receiver domain and an HTH DNA-binding domain n=1 Tax=Brachybacterium faecium (strain ATCC 43885 / DSM 4810 / JCM 11609 / LMG 19847 / NBRC 14762 / NCIMB 9860 / 6-10) TaxID=446465 RepID=C7MGM3_BRAFD|nr:response regulator transcription factor [Brachybacterium faecium]ACU84214.1 response regulator containing a CheY-like receiver domain and an HTH DNA-binding domain [Brachybacterium faecium DSM 4810]